MPCPALLCACALLSSAACDGGDRDAPEEGVAEPDGERARRGGNSGSEGVTTVDAADEQAGGDNTVPCPCNALGAFTRATVLTAGEGMLELRIDELLHGETDLVAGDVVQARFAGRMPCYRGVVAVGEGDMLLAVFSDGERVSADRYAGVRVTPWQRQLVMADDGEQQVVVHADDLDELWDNPSCVEERCEQAERKQCVPFWQLGCDAERACPDGFTCAQGACAPVDPDCEDDADCPGRWLCRIIDGGYCDDESEACVRNQLQLRTCVPPATGSERIEPDVDPGAR